MLQSERENQDLVKYCPMKQVANNRECDQELCEWYDTQHKHCLYVMYLRKVIKSNA